MMENGPTMSLESAKEEFTKLMNSLTTALRDDLLSFAIQKYITARATDDESDEGSYSANDIMDDPVALLNTIAKDLRGKVSLDAIMPSETITPPKEGRNSDCHPDKTRHIDAFLYGEEDLDDLVEEGKLNRNYCGDCGSLNAKPLIFISHSMSRDDLYNVFNTLLPPLDGKTVLDVGSRLGAVLYGAYAYTDAARIIGIEMNKEFCDLQQETVLKYKMDKRVEIVNERVEDAAELVKTADVVILNNVFEFYLTKAEQVDVWRFLRGNVKSGARLVARPEVAVSLSCLDTGIVVDEWLKADPPPARGQQLFGNDPSSEKNDDDSMELTCYVVL